MDYPLPEAFVRYLAGRLGGELSDFLRSMDAPYRRGLRYNRRKGGDAAAPGALDPIPWAADSVFLSPDSPAGAVPLHEAGAWYLQDPSAMLPPAALNVRPGERVLDLCAAPGGKSTALAAALAGQGLLVCNEPVPARAKILSRNIERMGVTNALVVSAWPDALAERWPEGFDAVLADAPCSGEGMFRRHPETRAEWRPESTAGCAARQREILHAAARLVRPGGRLVYATCTLNETENEDTVAAFLQAHPEFSLSPFRLPGADAPEGLFTCWPHRFPGEGQFAALLVKRGEGAAALPADRSLPAPDRQQLRILSEFAGGALPEGLRMLGDTAVSLAEIPRLQGLKVLRCGLHLGEIRGRLLAPDHAWALAAADLPFPRFPVTEAQAAAFQAGEPLEAPETLRGWVLPELSGFALGWGKASGGQLKNHYPKGLRRPR